MPDGFTGVGAGSSGFLLDGRRLGRAMNFVGARNAAQGKDVRLGGGATTIRQFLDADLVDALHVAVSPVELGVGSQLWESPRQLEDRFHCDVVSSPSGVTH